MRLLAITYPERAEMRLASLDSPPDPGRDQILIETLYSGITNGTERHAMMDEFGFGRYPSSHGYQQVGRIVATGEDVKGFSEGDLVYFGGYVGHRGWNLVTVGRADPHSNATHLVMRLPAEVATWQCALLGVASVAMRHVRHLEIRPGDNVWVAGQGLIGQFCAQAARAHGATVTVSDLVPRRLELALATGADEAVDGSTNNAWARLRQRGPYTHIIDACNMPRLYHQIQEHGLLQHSGIVGSVAVRGDTTFPWGLFHGLEGRIQVTCHFSLDDVRVVLDLLARGILQIAPLVLDRVPIDEAPSLYARLRDEPQSLLGVIFDWGTEPA
jgi:2-desacetyl-2-hydroxyethyl bacteriochlorophyllide A dehydrogenase